MKFSDFFAESSLSETDSADIASVDNPILLKKRLDETNMHNLKKMIREQGIKIKDYVTNGTESYIVVDIKMQKIINQ